MKKSPIDVILFLILLITIFAIPSFFRINPKWLARSYSFHYGYSALILLFVVVSFVASFRHQEKVYILTSCVVFLYGGTMEVLVIIHKSPNPYKLMGQLLQPINLVYVFGVPFILIMISHLIGYIVRRRKQLKKVLIVDDDTSLQAQWREALDGKVELISAVSIAQAQELFNSNRRLSAIVMDACVPGNQINTEFLVKKFGESYHGPIIAISTMPEYRRRLILAGCSHESSKEYLTQDLLKILDIRS